MRFRVLEAAAPGMMNSPSYIGFGRGVLETRCESVDFLSDDVRRMGDCADMGDEKENALLKSLCTRGPSSMVGRGAGG